VTLPSPLQAFSPGRTLTEGMLIEEPIELFEVVDA